MATRLSSDAVQVVSTGEHVMALVTGRNGRVYVVDRNAAWSPDWLCTCGWAPDCAHIRETRRGVGWDADDGTARLLLRAARDGQEERHDRRD